MGIFLYLGDSLGHCLRCHGILNGTMAGFFIYLLHPPCPCCHCLHSCPLPVWFLSSSCHPFSPWTGRVMNSPVISDPLCHAAAFLWQDKERLCCSRWDSTRLLSLHRSWGKFTLVKVDGFTLDKETMCQDALWLWWLESAGRLIIFHRQSERGFSQERNWQRFRGGPAEMCQCCKALAL